MRFMPESQQEEQPKVEVFTECGHTYTQTTYPKEVPTDEDEYEDENNH